MRRIVLLAGLACFVSCGSKGPAQQTPDAGPAYCYQQSVPIAGAQKPSKVMLVIDKSGSMKTVASSDTQWGCAADANGNGYDPSGNCKWVTLVHLLTDSGGFLDQTGASARHGLAIFSDPNNSADSCAAGSIEVPVPDTAGASINAIKTKLSSYVPQGGTPSAATLQNISADANFTRKEAGTKNYVVLITDGNPNCNASLATCSACTNGADPSQNCNDVRNCLDDLALTSAVQTLRAKDIDTFVIGFGSAFSNLDAKKALNDAAMAGGQVANDPQFPDAKFYLALDEARLSNILDNIMVQLQSCAFALDRAAVDPAALEVTVLNKKTNVTVKLTPPSTPTGSDGDFGFIDSSLNVVDLGHEWCTKLQNAEPDTYVVTFGHLQCQ